MKWRLKRGPGSHIQVDSYTRSHPPATTRAVDAFLFVMASFAMTIVIGAAFGVDVLNPNPINNVQHSNS